MKSSVTAVERNDHIETIVLYQRGQAEVESCKALITEMRNSYMSVNIKHQVVSGLGNLDVDAMGKIVIGKEPRRFPGNHCDLVPHLLESKVKEIGKFTIKTHSDKKDCCAGGVLYLPCDQIVVSDVSNNKLKLFTDKGQFLDELTIRGSPNDLCLVDNNTVAVAVDNPGGIHVVKVEASKLSLSSEIRMSNGKACYGITHTDGRFIVGTGDGGVYSVTQDGVADLLHQYNSTCYSLTHDPLKGDTLVSICNGPPGNVVVSRLSADKRHTDVMKVGVVRYPRGIDVDREGNIYVCGNSSYNVVQMSGDGTHVRELLTPSDGIRNPWAISINGDKFVVIDHTDNPIRICQLY
ncbi:uncharacterized protein LOC117320072 [Pecten maximus]|uniref:uncharacterized protein LOC117320072 n=1 Tax=Pecten maximus TaxID=6579 RepID=UPI001457F006|nr:uncharacterized protein LOC117320072 [Pecten maximus]